MDTNVAQLKCSNNKYYALTFIYIYRYMQGNWKNDINVEGSEEMKG